MKKQITLYTRYSFIVLSLLFLGTAFTYAQEVRMGTIMPSSNTVRGKDAITSVDHEDISDTDVTNNNMIVDGDLACGRDTITQTAHNDHAGNLDVNDAYIRAANGGNGAWASELSASSYAAVAGCIDFRMDGDENGVGGTAQGTYKTTIDTTTWKANGEHLFFGTWTNGEAPAIMDLEIVHASMGNATYRGQVLDNHLARVRSKTVLVYVENITPTSFEIWISRSIHNVYNAYEDDPQCRIRVTFLAFGNTIAPAQAPTQVE